ncbi:hypothetical protein [Paralcaligenes ginsengisoli]|jgi:hypothetical protein
MSSYEASFTLQSFDFRGRIYETAEPVNCEVDYPVRAALGAGQLFC